jgi:hypothetical protein
LRVPNGAQSLSVVADEALVDVGIAITYDRFRFYVNFVSPLLVQGMSGTVGNTSYTSPPVDLGTNPDSFADVRLGFDARVLGDATSHFRLGFGAQLYVPSDTREDYLTDGGYRAMGRVLVAGDLGVITYAAHLGVHIRPLDDSPTLGSPRGSELIFGVAAGPRVSLGDSGGATMTIGPEIFGASALDALFGSSTTALEALVSARIDGASETSANLHFKVGAGGGLDAQFGAPEFRAVVSIEVSDALRGSALGAPK